MTKIQNQNCDKSKNFNYSKTCKNLIGTKLINLNWDKTLKTQIATEEKLVISYKIQKKKVWQEQLETLKL